MPLIMVGILVVLASQGNLTLSENLTLTESPTNGGMNPAPTEIAGALLWIIVSIVFLIPYLISNRVKNFTSEYVGPATPLVPLTQNRLYSANSLAPAVNTVSNN